MTAGSPFLPDAVDRELLKELQRDGRQSVAELARLVHMSHSAVAERVRRLEEAGVVLGYRARIDPVRLGYSLLAFLRLRPASTQHKPLHELLAETPEVLEAHHVTGEDCFILKTVATSMQHLEQIAGKLGTLGSVTTSIAYSTPVPERAIEAPARPEA